MRFSSWEGNYLRVIHTGRRGSAQVRMNAPIDVSGHFYTGTQREWFETSAFGSLVACICTRVYICIWLYLLDRNFSSFFFDGEIHTVFGMDRDRRRPCPSSVRDELARFLG